MPWTQLLIFTFPKKDNLQLCQNYRTISLISHSSKVMLKTILNRLKPQAEEIIAEEQAGFRAGRSTTEKIFNFRILCEKYLQHQQNLYPVFIDFKKAYDRVWHAALLATMRKYNISANLVRIIEQLYDKAISAVQINGSIGEWFRTTVGVTASFTKLKPIWRHNNISLGSKVKLMRPLVIFIFLYACESWTLTAELEKKRRLLR